MPSVRVTNNSPLTLNVCLKHVAALHFENEVKPGQTVKLRPGKVYFTLEAVVDDGDNRYSVMKSAATIGIISLAVGSVALTAGAALIPESALLASVAAGTSSYLGRFALASKAAIINHAGTLAKVSAHAVPKAITALTASLGGMTALQREVLSILSSPLTPTNLRVKGLAILTGLRKAYQEDLMTKKDKQSEESRRFEEAEIEKLEEMEREARKIEEAEKKNKLKISGSDAKNVVKNELDGVESDAPHEDWKEGDSNLEGLSDADKTAVKQFGVVEVKGFKGPKVIRKHGIYVSERRHFEVRLVAPDLAIYDANKKRYL